MEVLLSFIPTRTVLVGCALLFGSCVIVGLSRLFLSPIRHIPGPKLAALTRWYEFWYEVVQKGQYTFKIQELHREYGPIIRVTPGEVHIQDADFFEELFARSGKLDKPKYFCNRFGTDNAFFTTPGHEHHKQRRKAVAPFFSQRRISEFEPVIQDKLNLLMSKLSVYADSDRILSIDRAFTALAGDVMTEFCFAKSYDHLESPKFAVTFHEAMSGACKSSTFLAQFPQLWPILNSLPDWLVMKLEPSFHLHIQVQKDFEKTITELKNGTSEAHKTAKHPTLFNEMLNSDLPDSEKTVLRLQQEAQVIIGAAILTTSWAMSVVSFHLAEDPQLAQNLRTELRTAIPADSASVELPQLEALPYLTGVVHEGIRLAYGIASRLPRVAYRDIRFKDWVIPAGTPISMTIVDMNHDEKVFPQSFEFRPERWLNQPKYNGNSLDKYFVGFGKGARSCLGMNLATSLLYQTLAVVFQKYDLELFETDVSDIRLAHDYFMPVPKLDSKGIRVKLRSA